MENTQGQEGLLREKRIKTIALDHVKKGLEIIGSQFEVRVEEKCSLAIVELSLAY